MSNQLPLLSESKKAPRNSSWELLRIVAMSMIVIYHFFVHGIGRDSMPHGLYNFILPFIICGVNLFFMISGWFLIKFSFKSIIQLAVTILCFTLINIAGCWLTSSPIQLTTLIKNLLFPISGSCYWFIKVYFVMLILAPFINGALKGMPMPMLRKLTILLTFVQVYSCSIGLNRCNPDGCSLLQGVYCYILAYYLRRDKDNFSRIEKNCWVFASLLIMLISGVCCSVADINPVRMLTVKYNSLPIILASATLVMWFSHLELKSKVVNRVAGAALGCYLLQDGLLGYHYLYDAIHKFYIERTLGESVLMFSALFVGFWLLSMIFSPIIKTFANALSNRADRTLRRLTPKFITSYINN